MFYILSCECVTFDTTSVTEKKLTLQSNKGLISPRSLIIIKNKCLTSKIGLQYTESLFQV